MALFDVNLLVALAWPSHVHHQAALAWFQRTSGGWLGHLPSHRSRSGKARSSSGRERACMLLGLAHLRVVENLSIYGQHRAIVNSRCGDDDLVGGIAMEFAG